MDEAAKNNPILVLCNKLLWLRIEPGYLAQKDEGVIVKLCHHCMIAHRQQIFFKDADNDNQAAAGFS